MLLATQQCIERCYWGSRTHRPAGGERFPPDPVQGDKQPLAHGWGDLRAATTAAAPILGTAAPAAHLREITRLRLQRVNRPDGYWIAAADPTAANHAITGNAPLRGAGRVRRAGLLTDGAADAVTRYHLHNWQSLLDLLTTAGPNALIGQVRTAEHADHTGHHQPRYKRHDDATAALCQFDPEQP